MVSGLLRAAAASRGGGGGGAVALARGAADIGVVTPYNGQVSDCLKYKREISHLFVLSPSVWLSSPLRSGSSSSSCQCRCRAAF